MTEFESQQYLLREYPQENARCEWKDFKKGNICSFYKTYRSERRRASQGNVQ